MHMSRIRKLLMLKGYRMHKAMKQCRKPRTKKPPLNRSNKHLLKELRIM